MNTWDLDCSPLKWICEHALNDAYAAPNTAELILIERSAWIGKDFVARDI